MNLRAVIHGLSLVCFIMALAFAACLAAGALLLHEAEVSRHAFGGPAALAAALGAALFWRTRGRHELGRREGFGVVAFAWLTVGLLGALPYLYSGVIPSPVGAIFESVSGFSTTGASVLAAPEDAPRAVLLWRALTHFLGGMGVLVLCVAILPFLGISGLQLYRAETSSLSKERLTPRIADTAKLLWAVYVTLTALQTLLLWCGGMSWFDAVCHAFATMATGGFSTRNASIAAFNSRYIETVLIVFMWLGATNFALHYAVLRGNWRAWFRDVESRFYIGLLVVAGLLVAGDLIRHQAVPAGTALRDGFFTVVSISTTTGFGTADFDAWPAFSHGILFLLMLMGGCVGSTTGAIKQLRVIVVCKAIYRQIHQLLHPQAVIRLKTGRQLVEPEHVQNALIFVATYLLIFLAAGMALAWFIPDWTTVFSAVAATLGNVGPGFAQVGPTLNYGGLPASAQLLLTGCMLLGRLEIFTLLVLFSRSTWRR